MSTIDRFVHYKTSIREVDDDHYFLFQRLDEVYALSASVRKEPEKFKRSIMALRDSLFDHLAHEERIMLRIKYKHTVYHKMEHNEIRTRMGKIADMDMKSAYHVNNILSDLEEVIVKHIDDWDLPMGMNKGLVV